MHDLLPNVRVVGVGRPAGWVCVPFSGVVGVGVGVSLCGAVFGPWWAVGHGKTPITGDR